MRSRVEQSRGHRGDEVAHGDALAPLEGDAGLAVIGPGDLAEDGAGGIGVVAEVDGQERPVAERGAALEGPEGRLQRVDDVAAAADLGRIAAAERTAGDLGDPRGERLFVPQARDRAVVIGQQLLLRRPLPRPRT